MINSEHYLSCRGAAPIFRQPPWPNVWPGGNAVVVCPPPGSALGSLPRLVHVRGPVCSPTNNTPLQPTAVLPTKSPKFQKKIQKKRNPQENPKESIHGAPCSASFVLWHQRCRVPPSCRSLVSMIARRWAVRHIMGASLSRTLAPCSGSGVGGMLAPADTLGDGAAWTRTRSQVIRPYAIPGPGNAGHPCRSGLVVLDGAPRGPPGRLVV